MCDSVLSKHFGFLAGFKEKGLPALSDESVAEMLPMKGGGSSNSSSSSRNYRQSQYAKIVRTEKLQEMMQLSAGMILITDSLNVFKNVQATDLSLRKDIDFKSIVSVGFDKVIVLHEDPAVIGYDALKIGQRWDAQRESQVRAWQQDQIDACEKLPNGEVISITGLDRGQLIRELLIRLEKGKDVRIERKEVDKSAGSVKQGSLPTGGGPGSTVQTDSVEIPSTGNDSEISNPESS